MDGVARIRGVGVVESGGVIHGTVVNVSDAAACIRAAYNSATTEAGLEADDVYLALSGSLVEHKVTAEVEIDGEVDRHVATCSPLTCSHCRQAASS
jgi:cell division ATPase FtsA